MPTLDNGLWKLLPDGRMETTWKIREGATWHDGTPFTADDLVFTAMVGQDKELSIFNHPGLDAVEAVRAIDPRTVQVTWNRPFFGADIMFTSEDNFAMPLPRHLLDKPYTDDKGGLRRPDVLDVRLRRRRAVQGSGLRHRQPHDAPGQRYIPAREAEDQRDRGSLHHRPQHARGEPARWRRST